MAMRIVVWVLRIIIFVTLFGLAVKNSAPVDVHLYLDAVWRAPLALVILASFVAGALIGMTALVVTLIRQRREISKLRGKLGEEPSNQPGDRTQPRVKGAA